MSKTDAPGVTPVYTASDEASPTRDSEKGATLHHGPTDTAFADNRETDFMTRNGMNLKSFQRR